MEISQKILINNFFKGHFNLNKILPTKLIFLMCANDAILNCFNNFTQVWEH